MTILIKMLTPTPNGRQVSLDTNLEFEISGDVDGYGADISTIAVQINNTNAILNGVFQVPFAIFSDSESDGYGELPESTTRFYTISNNPFQVGDVVQVTTSAPSLSPDSIETTIIGVEGDTIELKDTVELLDPSSRPSLYRLDISSISRGYQGSISNTNVTINPLHKFERNSVIFVSVDLESLNPNTASEDLIRKVFAFRTEDISPPQLINFPPIIYYSNLSFSIVDLLGNFAPSEMLSLHLDSELAVFNGIVQDTYMGSIIQRNDSHLDVYIRPKAKYAHNQVVNAQVTVADGYGNGATYNRTLTNKAAAARVEFISIQPTPESVLDPAGSPMTIILRTTEPLPRAFINVSYTVSGITNPSTGNAELKIIEAGEFAKCEECLDNSQLHSGSIRAGGRNIIIEIDDLPGVTFNSEVSIQVKLQEVTDLGDTLPDTPPFFIRNFDYKALSATLPPIIDNFFPSSSTIPAANTQIRFRILSQVLGDTIDLDSITVVIGDSTIAISEGLFTNGFSGSILAKQGSNGHTVNVVIDQPETTFEIGSTVLVEVTAAGASGVAATENFSFTIANTLGPNIIMSPLGGTYKKLTRVNIDTDQSPAIIYFTLDGSIPTIGQVNTFTGQSPIVNIPIFREGVTQIKAFATNSNGIPGPIITEIYDLNPFIPKIEITTPTNGVLIERSIVAVAYVITLERGFLTKVEFSLNNGPRTDVQNTLPNSTILVSGLRSGTNTIQIFATDNADNVGVAEVQINVKTSQILDFAVTYAPLRCPMFTQKSPLTGASFNDIIDTSTVAIIGLGKRLETLVDFALGDGADGSPIDFLLGNLPDGRHFSLRSYPVREETLKVTLFRKQRNLVLSSVDFSFEPSSGQLVLDHPVEVGEALTVEYISEVDVNTPRLYLPNQLNALFARHGDPSIDNTLSLASQIAFENGAARILAVQAESPLDDPTWGLSFKALEHQECYWITPVVRNEHLDFYPSIVRTAFNHVLNASFIKNKKERIVSSFRVGEAPNEFNNSRIIQAHIDLNPRITRITRGESSDLNGSFVAAAISGRGSGLGNIAFPLTGKRLTGLTLQTHLRSPKIDMDKVVAQGFLPVQSLAAGADIYRARTSYTGIVDPVLEEPSVQRTIDSISKNLRRLLENRFTGEPLTDQLLVDMRESIDTFLQTQSDIIFSGKSNQIRRDPQEPRQVSVGVDIVPLFPLNQFSFSISFVASL